MRDEEAAKAAYRALPWQQRWRLRRNAGFGRVAANSQDAAIMVWWARRQRALSVWGVPFAVYVIALVWGSFNRPGRLGLTVFAGVLWGYTLDVYGPQRLHRAITDNAHAAGLSQTEALDGLPSNTMVLALTAAAVVAAVVTVVAVF